MNDTTKLIVACLIFSFVAGMFTAVTLNLGREVNKGKQCTVTYSHGDRVHVLIGKR